MIDAELAALRDLCAVINGDGGHRQNEVGTVKAALEAERAYLALRIEVEKLKSEVERLQTIAEQFARDLDGGSTRLLAEELRIRFGTLPRNKL